MDDRLDMASHADDDHLRRCVSVLAGATDRHLGLDAALGLLLDDLGARATIVESDGEVLAARGMAQPLPTRLEIAGPDAPHAEAVELLNNGRLLVARSSAWAPQDIDRLHAYASAIELFLRMHAAQQSERTSADRSHRQAVENVRLLDSLIERQRLLERLTRIQRSISHRAPLQEVLDAICLGAQELFGDEVVGVRLVDPDNPQWMNVHSVVGVPPELLEKIKRTRVGEGAGGRAVAENRLVVVYEYERETNVVQTLAQRGLQSAMAAPVHQHGKALGSLVIATYQQGRRYSKAEQDALLAFAENVSIALTDAKTVSALREAQRVKEMFLAMASHELKTPLTAIMGTLRTFERHGHALNDDMRSAMLTAAIQRGEQLSHLINRLLIGARAELAKDEQVISLDELIDRSLQGFHDTTPVIVGEVPGLSVVSDARSVQGALGILLENAIAHSPDGSPVEVNSLVAGEEVRISVKNKGSLPDNADVENLFLPFQRGSEARSAGVGLGLYIASRLARSIGGFIDVKSVDDWVVFTLCFPLRSSSQIATGISG